jgi:type II secretory pathway component GspD/PulD (secretin)
MSNKLPVGVAMGAIAALIMSLPVSEQLCSAGQQAKSEDAKRTTYHVQNRSAAELASILGQHFKAVPDFQVVADGPTNTLLITANGTVMAELMNTLTTLDRKPQEVLLEVLVIDVAAKKDADGKMQLGEFDLKELSGPADRVLSNIKALETRGVFTSVKRFQLKGVVNQQAKLNETVAKAYTAGMVVTTGPGGKPRATRTNLYKNIGTNIVGTTHANPDGIIALELHVQDERMVQPEDAPLIGHDENGQPVRTTQFVKASLDANMSVPNGHAVLANDVQVVSSVAGERTLIVVTAKAQ